MLIKPRSSQPSILVFSAVSVCLGLFLINVNSGHSEETFTVNSKEILTLDSSYYLGVEGTLLASAPGSCTSVPNGLIGNCNKRAEATLKSWIDGSFFHGTTWSDLENSSTTSPIYTFLPPPDLKPTTTVGTSWVPELCKKPSCGYLLKGDSVFVDENGDGKFDATWIDDGDNIRETGEVDRLRADQFSWGAASTVLNFNNLGGPENILINQESVVSPPGLSRARVQVALGEEINCQVVTNNNCVLDGVIEGPYSITDDLSNEYDKSTIRDNNDFFGYCDPDQWVAVGDDLNTIQLKLDNCLWKVASSPVTAPKNAFITLEDNAIREAGKDQRVVSFVASTKTDRKFFIQNFLVQYSIQIEDLLTGEAIPIVKARYQNGIILEQINSDPNTSVNFSGTPETHNSIFRLMHTSMNRRYGEKFDETSIIDPDLNPLLQGMTNPTTNPFWEADTNGFGVDMNADSKSGAGQETGFKFIYSQNIGGHLSTCLGCEPDYDVIPPIGISYNQFWPQIPDIVIGKNSPKGLETFIIIPNP